MHVPGEGGLRRRLEGIPERVERRATLPGGALSHPLAAPLPASAALHPGRGGRRARSVAHAEHRPHAQDAFQKLTGMEVLILLIYFATSGTSRIKGRDSGR